MQSLDRQYVESVFETYAVQASGGNAEKVDEASNKNMIITQKNAWMAYEEIFKMWKIDLTEE